MVAPSWSCSLAPLSYAALMLTNGTLIAPTAVHPHQRSFLSRPLYSLDDVPSARGRDLLGGPKSGSGRHWNSHYGTGRWQYHARISHCHAQRKIEAVLQAGHSSSVNV